MSFDQIYNIIAGNVFAAVFFLLWIDERKKHTITRRRERAILREAADLPDEDASNGEE